MLPDLTSKVRWICYNQSSNFCPVWFAIWFRDSWIPCLQLIPLRIINPRVWVSDQKNITKISRLFTNAKNYVNSCSFSRLIVLYFVYFFGVLLSISFSLRICWWGFGNVLANALGFHRTNIKKCFYLELWIVL